MDSLDGALSFEREYDPVLDGPHAPGTHVHVAAAASTASSTHPAAAHATTAAPAAAAGTATAMGYVPPSPVLAGLDASGPVTVPAVGLGPASPVAALNFGKHTATPSLGPIATSTVPPTPVAMPPTPYYPAASSTVVVEPTVATSGSIGAEANTSGRVESSFGHYGEAVFLWFALLTNLAVFWVWTPEREPKGPTLDLDTADPPHDPPLFGWQFVWLTFWGGNIQLGYFACAVVDWYVRDRSGGRALRTRFHRDRYFGLAFAVATFITVVYFVLLFPDDVSKGGAEPLALTFFEHLLTGIFVWVELFHTPHVYRLWYNEAGIVLLFACVYLSWNAITWSQNYHTWPYSFQGDFTGAAGLLYLVLFALIIGCYFLGRVLTYAWHGQRVQPNFNGCCCYARGGCCAGCDTCVRVSRTDAECCVPGPAGGPVFPLEVVTQHTQQPHDTSAAHASAAATPVAAAGAGSGAAVTVMSRA